MGNYISKNTSAETEKRKQKLTHEFICTENQAAFKRRLPILILISFVLLAVAITITALLFTFGTFNNLNIILTIVIIIAYILIIANMIIKSISSYRAIQNNEYTIVTDSITSISEKNVIRAKRRSLEYVMDLSGFKGILIGDDGAYTNEIGDTVYVVVSDKNPKKLIRCYNSKYYDLEQ